MLCPHCSQEHPDNLIDCPTTGKKLKRACTNPLCSYYGEYLFPLEQDTCPCCGRSLGDTHNGHKFVDLGLSVKWATCNVGAMKPEDYGGYYQWAGTKDVSSTGIFLDERNCPYRKISGYFEDAAGWTKYNKKSIGNRTILDLHDDTANFYWGGNWRMPTDKEWKELTDNCKWKWTTYNGVKGYKITGKKPGFKNVFIFLPAAGHRSYNRLHSVSYIGAYWCSSLRKFVVSKAYNIRFNSDNYNWGENYGERWRGLSVRPVCE